VRLNTMEIAITRRVHPNALLLPEIKIIMDASGAILNPPLFIDLANVEENLSGRGIEEVIDPLTVGIDLLNFI
ncbi:MAG: hypothetical protein PHO30_05930, partial [Candidatus Omnitrophica bacterium]|nr:hypothetical protein [Candidatus Omnitrophota bacterium]